MKRVLKYSFSVKDRFELEMPKDAEVLCVMTQRGTPHIWALVEEAGATETRSFRIIVTGQRIDEDIGRYVGSFMLGNDNFVGHLFEAAR